MNDDYRAKLRAAMQVTGDAPPREIEIPGWGKVFVKTLTVEEADLDETQLEDDKKNKARLARGAARLICDATGARIFDPDSKDDVKLLKKQPWKLLRSIISEPEDEAAKGN